MTFLLTTDNGFVATETQGTRPNSDFGVPIFDFRSKSQITNHTLAYAGAKIKNVLCLVSCVLFLISSASLAQNTDPGYSMGDYPALNIQDRAKPDVQSYAEFCEAVYWEHIGNYEETEKHLLAAIQLNPKSSFLYAKLAETLIFLKKYRNADSACRKSLGLNPDNADAHYLLGVLNFARQDKEGAMDEFKRATELKPELIVAQARLAPILYEAEDYKGAANAYSKIVKLKPYDPDLRLRLGISYSRAGQTEEAIREFNTVVKLNSDYVDPHFHLAYLYARQSKNVEAIKECMMVLQVDPDNPNMNLLLGELYVSMSSYDEAIPRLERVLKRQRIEKALLAEAHFRLALAYKGKNDNSLADAHFQSSIDIYKEILEKEQGNAGVHYDIAMVYDAMGDLARAEQHLRKHIELNPDEPNAYNFLGYMFVEHDMNLEDAVALIRKAMEIEPRNGAFHDSLGWAYFKLGNLDEAIGELERASQLIPDDSEIRVHLGEVYLKKGGESVQKAISEWEKALEMKPGNAEIQKKLEELRNSLKQGEDNSHESPVNTQ